MLKLAGFCRGGTPEGVEAVFVALLEWIAAQIVQLWRT